ncbi:MAG TPA: sugar phosphate isomerase/epimerase family protein [Tepidisphaeraceae bacterium]|nr:sugar phosphate isomerase/epimerase family protein [Tepidisphaeraceae bacterium]
MKFGVCNELFGNWAWEQVCDYAREVGYHGIEVAPFTLAERAELLTPQRRAAVRQAAESRGLEIIGLHWLLVKPAGMYITHPDASIRKQTSDYFVELVNLCADLGGKVMVIGSPKQRNRLPGVKLAQAFEYAAEVFKPCLEPAARRGVTLAIEPLGGKETDFLMCAADGVELIEKINHPNFRLHLDVKAMSQEYKPIPQIIRESAKHLAHFHVNDPNLLGPGMGEVKYEPIIEALRQVGYDGWLSVEAFDFKAGAEHIAKESIRYLRQVTGA